MSNDDMYVSIIKLYDENISRYIAVEDYLIYHYTSSVAFNEIIKTNTLRFTDRNYLNDYSEGRYVLELCLNSRFEMYLPEEYRNFYKSTCRRLYDDLSIRNRNVFQCSFSLDEDNLSLWNYYTKSEGIKGYNIGFLASELKDKLVANKAIPSTRRVRIFGSKVIYNIKNQKRIIKNIVNDFAAIIYDNRERIQFCNLTIELLLEKIIEIGSFFKNPCFEEEKEYRLLMFLVSVFNNQTKNMEFMSMGKGAMTYEKNGLLIPYIDVEFKKEALRKIIISPTLSFDAVSGNIKNALKLYTFDTSKIEIGKSNIPIRY